MAFDCAIIGAGPAGMSAAISLSAAGADTIVLDRAPRAGGQIYRSVADSPLADVSLLGEEYLQGAALIEAYENSGATHMADADVWHIGSDGTILFSRDGETHQIQTREILICPGAMERPMPIPGWTLPGVMTAGSAQVMLKSDAVTAENAVFAGSGPLLYLIVAQYLRLGVKVAGLVDTTPLANYRSAMHLGPSALRSWPMLHKGLSLLREIRASGIPFYRNARELRILGDQRAEGLSFHSNGRRDIRSDTVFLHHGVIPQTNITRALGLDHVWSDIQKCWHVKSNAWGQSSSPHISVAGDGARISGAEAAQSSGRVAAANILTRLGRINLQDRDQQCRLDHAFLAKQAPFRRFIDTLYNPAPALSLPEDPDTLVCRCEEQSVQNLRDGFDKGAANPNALKSLTRCGMGPCQGRQCGPIVTGLLAKWRGISEADVGYYRLRSPQRLLNLKEFSRFHALSAQSDKEAAE